jgi:hypothetical protein
MPYSGRCRGGVWDGKDLSSEWRTYQVPFIEPLSLRAAFGDAPLDASVIVKYGFYEYVLGQWVWHAPHS